MHTIAENLFTLECASTMTFQPVFLRPQRLVYVRSIGPYSTSIPQAWSELFNWIEKNNFNSYVSGWFGIAHDRPSVVGEENCRFDAAIPVNPMFEDRGGRELGLSAIPNGAFLRRKHRTGYDALTRLVPELFHEDSIRTGWQPDIKRPVVAVYLSDPRKNDPQGRAELCVPVKQSTGRVSGGASGRQAAA